MVARDSKRGVLFAYDEAQNLADTPPENEFPLSLLLDVFQSIQRQDIPFMLVLTRAYQPFFRSSLRRAHLRSGCSA